MNKDELQQLAQQKEHEWREINEKRIKALEEELKETVQALELERKNFSQLKEDFKYNLKLLDDRDKELGNIENYYSVLRKQLSDKEGLISELKIEIDEFKKTLEKEHLNQDEAKKFYLERLNEKQLEFEKYKLIKDNEVKKERSEIENHKRTLQNHIESLKYDLERQRNELKNEFDEVMRKREHEWRKTYDEQGADVLAKELHIKLLTNEIEQIRETNKRLQFDFDDLESKHKKLERGMKEKDWELKDNVSLKDAKIQDLEARIKELENSSKKQAEDFRSKVEKMDKTIRDKDLQVQQLKENRLDLDKERKSYEDKVAEYKAELEEKERCMEKFIEEKGQIILNLTEEVLRLKTSNNKNEVIQSENQIHMEIEPTVINHTKKSESNKQSLQELRAENNDLKAEKKLHLKYLSDYKVKLEKALEREQKLEQEKAQVDLDWQKKYQELENTKYLTSEDYLKKLSDSRDQAVSQVKSLEERLKQKEAIINALKSSNPTLDALNTEVYESKYKEENEYLKQIIKQMRDEIEVLANDIPQKDRNNATMRSTRTNQVENGMNQASQKLIDSGLALTNKTDSNKIIDNAIINDHIESLNQKISILRKEKLELTSYLKKQQIRLMHLEKTISNTNEQSQGKQTKIETLQYELNSQTRRHTSEVNSLKQRIAELELELNESHKEADEYHKNVIQKESEISSLELKISELKLKLSSSGTQINFGQQELFIQQLQDEVQRLNEKLLNKHSDDNVTNVDGLTINELNYLKEIKSLKTKLKALAKHLSQLIHEKQQLIEMSNQLRAELDRTRKNYEEVKFKKFNKENYIDDDRFSAPVDNLLKANQLKKIEDIQYNLTKKDLAFANFKNTQSHPELRSKSSTEKGMNSSYTSEGDNKTLSSSIRSENLQELWKILDENAQYSHRDNSYDTRPVSEKRNGVVGTQRNVNKNDLIDQLSARGEKKQIQSKTTVIKDKKPKIRNYNLKDN